MFSWIEPIQILIVDTLCTFSGFRQTHIVFTIYYKSCCHKFLNIYCQADLSLPMSQYRFYRPFLQMTASLFVTVASSFPRVTVWLLCLSMSSGKSVIPSWRVSEGGSPAISRYREACDDSQISYNCFFLFVCLLLCISSWV